MSSLIQCSNFSQLTCIIKLIEAIIATGLLCFCLTQIILHFQSLGRLSINCRIAILILMLFSLSFNLAHCIDSSQRVILFLQLYFANLFFLTIFFYVGDNVLSSRWTKIVLYCFVGFMLIAYTGIIVLRQKQQSCSQLWYIIVDVCNILLSIIVFLLYWKKNMEEKKMELFYSQSLIGKQYQNNPNFNSPFFRMWILISSNIFCGVVNLIETAVLYFDLGQTGATCSFSTDASVNAVIYFAFHLSDYYLGSLVTLMILHRIRVLTEERMKIDKERKESYTVESAQANKLELIGTNRSFSMQSGQFK